MSAEYPSPTPNQEFRQKRERKRLNAFLHGVALMIHGSIVLAEWLG